MSELSERILSVEPARSISGKRKGLAPKIRRLKDKFPELSYGAIARRVGCSANNVSGVLRTYLGDNTVEELRDYQENQADIFDSLANRLLASLTRDKIEKTKPMEAITGAAILIDKARLVRGQATGINVNVLLDVAEAIRSRPAVSSRVVDAAAPEDTTTR